MQMLGALGRVLVMHGGESGMHMTFDLKSHLLNSYSQGASSSLSVRALLVNKLAGY